MAFLFVLSKSKQAIDGDLVTNTLKNINFKSNIRAADNKPATVFIQNIFLKLVLNITYRSIQYAEKFWNKIVYVR